MFTEWKRQMSHTKKSKYGSRQRTVSIVVYNLKGTAAA